jgi:hypothetical protein
MSTPLPDTVSVLLRTSATAAMGALLLISVSHRELFAWAVRMIGSDEPSAKAEAKPNGAGRATRARKARPPIARKPATAYNDRRRSDRDEADARLLKEMKTSPGATIAEWAIAIGRSKTATNAALRRLRDADRAESVEGKWRLTEEPAPREPAPKWVSPVRGADRSASRHLTAAS